MPLSFRQLEVVYAVSRHGSVTAAAAALGISQPAVSMMLRDCAEASGFPLFRRQQGRLQPTAEARRLLSDLERIFEGVDRVGRMIEEMRDVSVGSVNVAATAALTESLLPRAIALLRQRRPGIQISVAAMDILGIAEMVTEERVDFGLTLALPDSVDARRVPLCQGDLVAVVPAGHALAGRAQVGPTELAEFPLISFSRLQPLGQLVEECFQQVGVRRRIAIEVNQSAAACALVRAGAGVTVIDPFLLLERELRTLVVVPLRPAVQVTAQALVPRHTPLSRPARLLLAALRRVSLQSAFLRAVPGEAA